MNPKYEAVDADGEPVSLRRRPRKPVPGEEDLVARGGEDLEARLKAERVQEMLRAMPQWQLTLGDKAITRAKTFPSAEVALLYGTFVTGFAKALKLPVNLSFCGARVLVTLHAPRQTGQLTGLTEHVVQFAQKLG